MKKISIILNVILVVIVAIILVMPKSKPECQSKSECKSQSQCNMSALDAIMTRTSVRSYTSKKIDESQIETILRAGMAAPTAGNKQPWVFIVVTDPKLLAQIPTVIKSAKMAANAPLAIISCGIPMRSIPAIPEYWIQDVSAANENMLLAAHALGLGAVWCGAYPDQGGRVAKMQEMFNMPEGVVPLSVTVFGHPAGDNEPKEKWAPEKVFINQYDDNL